MNKGILIVIMFFVGCQVMSAQSLCAEIHGNTLPVITCISVNKSKLQLPAPKDNPYNAVESIRSEMIEAITYEERTSPVSVMSVRNYAVPEMKFSREKGPNLIQTLGYIAVGVTRALVFPFASEHPDL